MASPVISHDVQYREASFPLLRDQGTHRVDDFIPSPIGDGNGEDHSLVGPSLRWWRGSPRVKRAAAIRAGRYRLHPHPLTMDFRVIRERPDLRYNGTEDARNLLEVDVPNYYSRSRRPIPVVLFGVSGTSSTSAR